MFYIINNIEQSSELECYLFDLQVPTETEALFEKMKDSLESGNLQHAYGLLFAAYSLGYIQSSYDNLKLNNVLKQA